MSKLRYAVFGVGGIARVHFNNLLPLPEVELVGLSDVSEPMLKKISAEFPDAFATPDPAEIFSKVKPDLVSVCTPNRFHHPLVMQALEAGAHVICEKPLAMTLEQAVEMEAAREKAGLRGLINFSYRNVPTFRFAKKLIANGELGSLTRVSTVYLQSHLGGAESPYTWRLNGDIAGFGALGDLGVHMIDGVQFITGQKLTSVAGQVQTLIPRKRDAEGIEREVTVDTNCAFLAQFENGMLGTFETTQIAPGYGNYFRIEISGEKGTLAVCSDKGASLSLFAGRTLTDYGSWTSDLPEVKIPTKFNQSQGPNTPASIVPAILGEKVAYPTFSDGVKAQAVLDAIFRSANSRAWVDLEA